MSTVTDSNMAGTHLFREVKTFLETHVCVNTCGEPCARLRNVMTLTEARMQLDAELWEAKYKALKLQLEEIDRAVLRAKAGAL